MYIMNRFPDILPAIGVGIAFAVLFFLLIWCAVGLTFYILRSVGTYRIAKRRGIRHAWLSWIPIAREWIIGCISDQYHYVTKGKTRNFRKILLWFSIARAILLRPVFSYVILVNLHVPGIGALPSAGIGAAILLLAFLAWVVYIAFAVLQLIALYDAYRSCNPDTATAFLILSIFFAFLINIFLFADRNKDLGMPPRKEDPVWEPL